MSKIQILLTNDFKKLSNLMVLLSVMWKGFFFLYSQSNNISIINARERDEFFQSAIHLKYTLKSTQLLKTDDN